MLWRYLKSLLRIRTEYIIGGKKNYEKWKEDLYSLQQQPIKNKALAKEMENACKKSNGVLTMEEYFQIDQFGKNGYHAIHSSNGNTNSVDEWAPALVNYIKNNKFKCVLDIGCGDGKLGITMAKLARKQKYKFTWHGVDINPNLFPVIKKGFEKEKILDYLGKITPTIGGIKLTEKTLVVFSFSLDSIAPQLVINASEKISPPNALIGVTVKDGLVSEKILTRKELKAKGISLKNGIFYSKNLSLDLSLWQLHPWQRAGIPIGACKMVADTVSARPKESAFFVLDEFSPQTHFWDTDHLAIPRDLTTASRDVNSGLLLYPDTGEHLLYFPSFLPTYLSLFQNLGLTNIKYGLDFAYAKYLSKNEIVRLRHEKRWRCYGLSGVKTGKTKKLIKLGGPFDPPPYLYHFRES